MCCHKHRDSHGLAVSRLGRSRQGDMGGLSCSLAESIGTGTMARRTTLAWSGPAGDRFGAQGLSVGRRPLKRQALLRHDVASYMKLSSSAIDRGPTLITG